VSKLPHPPFCDGPAGTKRDWSTKEGARELGSLIRQAWAACGHDVPVEIVCTGRDRDGDAVFWAPTMPTLVNGVPTKRIGE
jgi:sugar (pentulose or hexulose) kinase